MIGLKIEHLGEMTAFKVDNPSQHVRGSLDYGYSRASNRDIGIVGFHTERSYAEDVNAAASILFGEAITGTCYVFGRDANGEFVSVPPALLGRRFRRFVGIGCGVTGEWRKEVFGVDVHA